MLKGYYTTYVLLLFIFWGNAEDDDSMANFLPYTYCPICRPMAGLALERMG